MSKSVTNGNDHIDAMIIPMAKANEIRMNGMLFKMFIVFRMKRYSFKRKIMVWGYKIRLF